MSLVTCVRGRRRTAWAARGREVASLALDAIERPFADGRRQGDVDACRQVEQPGQRVVRGDEVAVGVVRDGDRNRRACHEIGKRPQPRPKFVGSGVGWRLEQRGQSAHDSPGVIVISIASGSYSPVEGEQPKLVYFNNIGYLMPTRSRGTPRPTAVTRLSRVSTARAARQALHRATHLQCWLCQTDK